MVAANLLSIFFFFLPFQFSLGSFGGSDIASVRLLLPLIFFWWVVDSLRKKRLFLPKATTLFAFTSFLLWMLLSVFWAENQGWAFRKAIFWLNFFPFFLVLVSVLRKKEFQEKILSGLLYGAGLVALVGITQFFSQFFIPIPQLSSFLLNTLSITLGVNFATAVAQYPSIFVNIGGITFLRAFAFFPDPHIFAYYTGMIFPLAVYRALQPQSRRREKWIPILLFLATLLSFSRASYVALIVVLIICTALLFQYYRSKISVPLILFAVLLGGAIFMSPIAARFQSSFSESDGSTSERARLWQEAFENIQKQPVAGVGLGNYPLFVKPSAEPREPIYVHNLYLDLAVELGIVGLFFFVLFIISCIPQFSRQGNEFFSYRMSLFCSLGIFLTHSLFEYPLFSIHILTLFLALLALLYVEKIHI